MASEEDLESLARDGLVSCVGFETGGVALCFTSADHRQLFLIGRRVGRKRDSATLHCAESHVSSAVCGKRFKRAASGAAWASAWLGL